MRIAVFAEATNGSSHYRAFEPVEAVARRGGGAILSEYTGPADAQQLTCDVALISRYVGRGGEQLTQQLRRAGLGVVWQIDDAADLSTVVKRTPRRLTELRHQVQTMMRLADVVVTTCEPLAAHYGSLTRTPIHVVENYLGPQFERVVRRPHEGLVLGWAAWSDHMADWHALGLQEPIARLLEAHPDLRVESLGPIDLRLSSARYTRRPAVEFDQLARHIADFDIGIAPIVDNGFNAARSDIKVKEYAALGIPWLASPIGPYAELGEQQGGRLVADDRWFEELDRIVRDRRGRKKLAKHGRAWAATQTIDRNAERWEHVFQDAIEHAHRRRSSAA